MPNRGEYQTAGGIGSGDDYIALNKIPYGYYPQSSNGWAPEIRAKKSAVANHIGLTPEKIIAGNTICGITGTATIESLGGCIPYSNTIKVTYTSGESTAKTINIGFKPKFVIVKPKTDVRCYMRSEAFSQFNRGWTDYDSSTGTENDYKTKITGFTSNGFIYNNFYNPDKVGTVSRTETLTFAVIAM